MNEQITPVVHFVGFRRDEYWSAVKIWGKPHYIHPTLDAAALKEIHESDTVIIAGKVRENER